MVKYEYFRSVEHKKQKQCHKFVYESHKLSLWSETPQFWCRKFHKLKRTTKHAIYIVQCCCFPIQNVHTKIQYFIDLVIFHLDNRQQSLCHLHTTHSPIFDIIDRAQHECGRCFTHSSPRIPSIDFSMCEIFIWIDWINWPVSHISDAVKRISRITWQKNRSNQN